MTRFATAFFFLVFMNVSVISANAQKQVALDNIERASGIRTPLNKTDKLSIKDQIFASGLYCYFEKVAYNIYVLDGKYRRFSCWIGVSDTNTAVKDGAYQIKIDGKVVAEGTVSSGDEAKHLEIDVSGVRSICLRLHTDVVCAEPTLFQGGKASIGGKSDVAPSLLSPDNLAHITAGQQVTLSWKPVPGAVSYAIEIVCTKSASSVQDKDRIWTINVNGATLHKLDLHGFSKGEYHWSVIAFNETDVIGKFSNDRIFLLDQ